MCPLSTLVEQFTLFISTDDEELKSSPSKTSKKQNKTPRIYFVEKLRFVLGFC